MEILVTGANGFIGRAVCDLLAQRGHHLRGAVRSASAREALHPRAEAFLVGNPHFSSSWEEPLRGADAVIHLIGRTHRQDASDPAALPLYRETNAGITGSLLEACASAGTPRFLYLSSVKAVGEGGFDIPPYDESTPPHPEDAYGKSKLEAEVLIRSAGGGFPAWTILRTPLVYGPGARGNFRSLFEAVRSGRLLPLGKIANARSLIYAGNLAAAVATCLESPGAEGRIFHAADSETPSTPELARLIGEAAGRPARLLPVPTGILRLGAALAGRNEAFRKLAGSLVLRTEAIREALGFRPPFSLTEGLAITARAWDSR
jgi:nucleoside-diphosphate-sugar epimerase